MAGEIFKDKRIELGLDIRQIAELLKIKADYLNSIENDLFDKLPAGVYTKGYIRSYAKYLDIDPEPIIQYYSQHLSHPKASTIIPIASSRKRTSTIFYLIPVVLVVIAAFFIYQQIAGHSSDKPPVRSVIVPEEKKTEPVLDNNPLPVETNSVVNEIVPVVKETRPAVNETKPVVPERKGHSVNITASENTWILIRYEDGKTEEIFLHPNESDKLEFPGKVYLRIGNAGGIKINLDGKDMGVLGDKGQVIDLTLPAG